MAIEVQPTRTELTMDFQVVCFSHTHTHSHSHIHTHTHHTDTHTHLHRHSHTATLTNRSNYFLAEFVHKQQSDFHRKVGKLTAKATALAKKNCESAAGHLKAFQTRPGKVVPTPFLVFIPLRTLWADNPSPDAHCTSHNGYLLFRLSLTGTASGQYFELNHLEENLKSLVVRTGEYEVKVFIICTEHEVACAVELLHAIGNVCEPSTHWEQLPTYTLAHPSQDATHVIGFSVHFDSEVFL